MQLNRFFSLVLVLSLVLAVTGSAAGQGPARFARMKKALGLTDAQAAEVSVMLKKRHDEVLPLKQQLRARNQELRAAISAPEPNASTVGQLFIARRALQKQIRTLNSVFRNNLMTVLTQDQRQKLRRLTNRMARRANRTAIAFDDRRP